jgi:hypothetical protein
MKPKNSPPAPLRSAMAQWGLTVIMLLGLPPVGIVMAGKELNAYLQFPPLTGYVEHAPFCWPIFLIYGAVDLLAVLLMVSLLAIAYHRSRNRPHHVQRMPAWGWLGLSIMLTGWLLAWTRMDWFAAWQKHTFILPWFGYILFVNAWCVRRTGWSLLTDAPARFWALFPASSLFWWFFEYLNRFVQNWYYVGVENFSPLEYIVFASLSFATVLPAVLSTYRLLLGFDLFGQGLKAILAFRFFNHRATATVTLSASVMGLLLLGLYPDWLYPFLWISPLLVIICLQTLFGRPTILAPVEHGDWGPLVAAPLAALICGFFWEMWNFGSLAHWCYTIPFVDRYHMFAMPILGYGGYLPFGLECLAIGAMVLGHQCLHIDTARSEK